MLITMYYLCYFSLINILLLEVQCFNFDTDFPIIYRDPFTFNGNNLEKDSYFGYSVLLYGGSRHNEPWIQIGAPRGPNPYRYNKTTGVLFRCGIKSPCYHIPLDSSEIKGIDDEAYFGNVMDISSDNDMYTTCGHRWMYHAKEDYYIQGACFSGRAYTNKTDFFTPLKEKNDQTIKLSASGKYVYNMAQAQIGFSAQFVKDSNELLVGLPGFLNWKGVPGLLRRQYQPPASRRRRDTLDFAETKIPDGLRVSDIKYFDFGGYSVTTGKFFADQKLYYVTGAPRANMKGSVLVFDFGNEDLQVKLRKDGTNFGEYFGSSVTASDVNGDGLEDLIVGAPFHKSAGSDGKFDDGAIYVYLGSEDQLIDAETNIIEGKSSGGRFGESLMSLGDIDKDGYSDIAVAAPYENDNSGVVYIYRGHQRTGLIKEPSQIIIGKNFIPNVKGFGISFSKPADVDGNNYKDLAIGAYKSGHAVLLRAKPVVMLVHTLRSTIQQINTKDKGVSFDIHSCAAFHGENVSDPIRVTREITVDPDNPGRATIDSIQNLNSEMSIPHPNLYCETFTIRISDSNQNYDPIVIKVELKLITENKTSSKIFVTGNVDGDDNFCKTCPVSGNAADTTKEVSVDYNRGCRDNKICYSKLSYSAVFLNFESGVYIIGSEKYITMQVIVTNMDENAYQTEIEIAPPYPVRLRSIPSTCKEISSVIYCNIDNPLESNASKNISLEMDLEEVNSGKYEDVLDFPLNLRTTSNNTGETSKILSLKLVKNADIEVMGKSNEETYSYKNRTYGKARFQQTYKIIKHDISPVQRVELCIFVPTTISIGSDLEKFLSVYNPEGTLAGQSITCSSDIKFAVDNKNVAGAVGEIDKKKRRRREVATVDEHLSKYPSNRTIYMNCTSEDITCEKICCTMGPFKNAKHVAEIKLKMDLNVSGLTGYMAEKDIFIVSTNAHLKILDQVKNNNSFSYDISVPSVFIGPTAEQSVASWIIIVAIICGILLLLLLAGVLYKLGFFKRTKKEMLINEKAKKSAGDQTDPLREDDGP